MGLTINERYEYLVNVLAGGNQREFAKKIGIGYTVVNKLIRNTAGVNPDSQKYINRICETFPDVNRKWLMTGEGEPGVSTRSNQFEALLQQLKDKDSLIAELQEELQMQRKVINSLLK